MGRLRQPVPAGAGAAPLTPSSRDYWGGCLIYLG